MKNLNELRNEVRHAHRLATKKVSRLRSKGVEIGFSDLDPRRDLSRIKRYTEKQLRAYMSELETFRSRKVSYVATARGTPISGSKWREYKRLEREFNKRAERAYSRLSDTFLPSHGMTIGQRDELMRSDLPFAGGERRPFDPIERSVRWIASEKALDKLIKDMRNKVSPEYEQKTVSAQRRVSMKMSRDTGSREIRNALRGLSDDQFSVLWNYTNFPTLLSAKYESTKEKSPDWLARVADDSNDEIGEMIAWAKELG